MTSKRERPKNKRVCDLPDVISVKNYRKWSKQDERMRSDLTKLTLKERIFGKNSDTSLLFIYQTSYCPNLRANEQISFDLQLSKRTQKRIQTLTFRGRQKLFLKMKKNSLIAKSS